MTGQTSCYRSDVYGIGASKQRGKIENPVGWLVAAVKNIAAASRIFPRVSGVVVGGSDISNGAPVMRSGGAECGTVRWSKNPKRLVGVVLALVDTDDQLRVRYPPPSLPKIPSEPAKRSREPPVSSIMH